MIHAQAQHSDYAVVEHLFADLTDGPWHVSCPKAGTARPGG